MMRKLCIAVLAVVLGVASANCALAADGGTLKGKFVYGGAPGKPLPVKVTGGDAAYCGKTPLVDESLVVNDKGDLANVVVYLATKRGDKVAIHPSYDALKSQKVAINNEKCRFAPHVTLLWNEQTATLGNKDTIAHNMKVDCISNTSINPILPAGAELDQKFKSAELLPVKMSCSIHPWMNGWLVVKDHPYFAVSGEDGTFEIKNIPAGDWEFQVWHEKAGYVRDVEAGGKKTTWTRGRVPVKITEGGTADLGTVKVSASLFEK